MEEKAKCPYCGATLRSSVCEYCGSVIPDFKEEATFNEYRTKKSVRADLTFWNTLFPGIFAFSFGVVPIIFLSISKHIPADELMGASTVFLFVGGIFGVIGLVALIIILRSVINYLLVSMCGTDCVAVVSGYSKSSYTVNNNRVYSVKLLLNEDGERYYIYLDTGAVEMRYVIGSRVEVRKYKNLYRIAE